MAIANNGNNTRLQGKKASANLKVMKDMSIYKVCNRCNETTSTVKYHTFSDETLCTECQDEWTELNNDEKIEQLIIQLTSTCEKCKETIIWGNSRYCDKCEDESMERFLNFQKMCGYPKDD